MVVVLVEAAVAVAELPRAVRERVHRPGLGEERERPVDGREAEPLAARPQPLVQLLGGDVVALAHQLREHGHALAGGPQPALPQEPLGGIGLRDRRHGATVASVITRIVLITGLALAAGLAAAGCGTDAAADGREGTTKVVAGFYPLAFAAEEIGGEEVSVTNLTPPGAEPHDVELSVRDVEAVRAADLVLYLGEGFQPALERALEGADVRSLDLLEGIELREGEDEHADEEEANEEDEHVYDPHVWLDPVLFAEIAERMGAELGGEGPARQLASRLRALDREYRDGLTRCERRELVSAHDAFGYLAQRYDLEVIPIGGISPEAEPSPRDLERVAQLVRERGVTTVFVEPLLSPAVGETVAREAGAQTAVLNPLEGLTEDELARGEDYFSVMRANLEALRAGLGCP
jgi:zinc transport system substrate-binding protein